MCVSELRDAVTWHVKECNNRTRFSQQTLCTFRRTLILLLANGKDQGVTDDNIILL